MKEKLRIWYFHNYTMLPEHGTLNRGYYLGKYLCKLGCEPIVFTGSHPHNTDLQLIEDRRPYKVYQKKPFPWVLIRTRNYGNSRRQQIISMIEFYKNSIKAVKKRHYPDAIIGSSAHPLAALLAIRLAKSYKCQSIIEIRDLWPESIVEYGILKENNPIIQLLYRFEKYLYVKADKVIFTQEGAYAYIKKKNWQNEIPEKKVFFLNNGVDNELFEFNRSHYQIIDDDLENNDILKIVYTGSIKKANDIGYILDIAKFVENSKIKFLIWGGGDEEFVLRERVRSEKIKNVVFKGSVEKKYIPFITSKADYNILDGKDTSILRYGLSANKIFDYFAAGKPVITFVGGKYNPILSEKAGIFVDNDANTAGNQINELFNTSQIDYVKMCKNAKNASEKYDYMKLAEKLVNIIESK